VQTQPAVVLVHNRYQQPGGEDDVFAAEHALLTARGHAVTTYVADNGRITRLGRARLAAATIWNSASRRDLRTACSQPAPVVAHFHNTFPLISPSAYYGARDAGAIVVQTLHNFRLICPGATLFRNGRACDTCTGRRVAWPGVLHGCYRQDRLATAVTATMIAAHHAAGTWRDAVSVYIALTEFAKRRFIEGGLPAERIVVKPNFLRNDPGPGEHRGRFALFVGRISPEKGIDTLLDAYERGVSLPLKIAGAGPLERVRTPRNVEWLGRQSPADVIALMKAAAVLVLPSTCYEGFPLAVLQAFATGLPVVASGHGSLAEIVDNGRTGLLFEPGDAGALTDRLEWAAAHPFELRLLGAEARSEFELRYTADRNYRRLIDIYRSGLAAVAASIPPDRRPPLTRAAAGC
jgi:glycosyltransferase involved in cell wall biosynthesis